MDGGSHANYLNCCFASIAVLTWPFGIHIHSGSSNNSFQRDLREMKNCVMSTLFCFKSPTLLFRFRDLDGCKS